MDKKKIKNLSFTIGGVCIMVTGLLFVLLTDLYLKTLEKPSLYLLLSIILAFTGSICFLLSDNFKDKKKMLYILKGIGVAFSIGFVIFLLIFLDKTANSEVRIVFIINMCIAMVAVVLQIVNLVFNAVTGVEE